MSGRVVALHVRPDKTAAPRALDDVVARVGGGLEGDIHARRAVRGVLVVDRTTLDDLGLAPGSLREQITVAGLPDLTTTPAGTEIRLGGVRLRVTGECEPCTHIGALLGVADVEGFRRSLLGRRGALCTVVAADGPIRVGDAVEVLVAR